MSAISGIFPLAIELVESLPGGKFLRADRRCSPCVPYDTPRAMWLFFLTL